MINISLLEDNTVMADYDDGTNENVNSSHSHKALSDETKALAEAFVYGEGVESEVISFNGLVVRSGQDVVTPLDDQPLDVRLATFCGIVFGENAKRDYILSLPTVDVVKTKSVQKMVNVVKKKLKEILVDGELVPDPDGQMVPETAPASFDIRDYDIVDGSAVEKTITMTENRVIIEQYPEADMNGDPVMIDAPVLDDKGEVVTFKMIQYQGNLYTFDQLVAK